MKSTYCVEAPDMLEILERDDTEVDDSDGATLAEILERIEHVDDVMYDGHLGHYLWFTVDKEHDTPELHAQVVAAMDAYSKER